MKTRRFFLKRMLSVLMTIVLTLGIAPLNGFVGLKLPSFADLFSVKAEAESYSGTCGDNLTWEFDTDTGVLTISGTGEMYNYKYSTTPWFKLVDSINSVVMDDSITSIGDYAFYSCDNLTSITIPDSVRTIGNSAFSCCDSLESVTIGDSVTTIGDDAFSSCGSLESVTIPDSVRTIGNYAFASCTSFTNVYYTGDIAGWCGITFADNTSNPMSYAENVYIDGEILTNATVIPDGITEIKNYAFCSCDKLESVTIGDSVRTIGNYAFAFCDSLESVTIGNSVITIGYYAFCGCTSLRSITIPKSVTEIKSDAFSGCIRITELSIMNPDIKIDNIAFYGLKSLRTFKLPEGMKEIPNEFLIYAETLSSIVIPDGVETIGKNAFNSCYCLKKMYIPKSVKAINQGALSQCFNFESIYYEGTEEEWNKINLDTADNGFIVNAKMFFNSQIEDMGVSKEDAVNKADLQMRLDTDNASLNYGDVLTLGTIITGAGSSKYFVTYSSSNEKIATVDENGNVTAHQKGNAVITCTVTDVDGNTITDTCNVTVNFTFVHWLLYIICFGWIWM